MISLKTWKNNAFVILFLLITMCNCGKVSVQSDPPDPEPIPAEPVDIILPEALFTDADLIADGRQSTVIMDRLIALIDAVPKDGSIYISIYMFEYEPLLMALERAYTRNVSLHIMMDRSDRSDNTAMANKLAELEGSVEIVWIYNNASGSAINHNKFVLLPEITASEGSLNNVIFQTSQNFNESGNHKIQDGIILSDADLYKAYLEYWQKMKSLANEQMAHFEYFEYEDSSSGITAYFHPKRKNGALYGDDTIVGLLDDIEEPSSAIVKIGMSAWTDSRIVILEKLEKLLWQGAEIEVIAKNSIGTETYKRLEALAKNGATIKIFNMTNSDQQMLNIHSKFMMIEGVWQGQEMNLLLTGTQNFTMNALRNNNEVTLLFRNHKFFSDYEAYYELLKELPSVCCDTSQH